MTDDTIVFRGSTIILGSDRWLADGDLVAARNEHGDGFVFSVSEEQAIDSYNQEFICTAYLSREQAVALRDWLTSALQSGPPSRPDPSVPFKKA